MDALQTHDNIAWYILGVLSFLSVLFFAFLAMITTTWRGWVIRREEYAPGSPTYGWLPVSWRSRRMNMALTCPVRRPRAKAIGCDSVTPACFRFGSKHITCTTIDKVYNCTLERPHTAHAISLVPYHARMCRTAIPMNDSCGDPVTDVMCIGGWPPVPGSAGALATLPPGACP